MSPLPLPGVAAKHPTLAAAFQALTSGGFSSALDVSSFALMGVTVNGEDAAAIVAVTRLNTNDYRITPLFVSLTPGMTILDDEGNAPDQGGC